MEKNVIINEASFEKTSKENNDSKKERTNSLHDKTATFVVTLLNNHGQKAGDMLKMRSYLKIYLKPWQQSLMYFFQIPPKLCTEYYQLYAAWKFAIFLFIKPNIINNPARTST